MSEVLDCSNSFIHLFSTALGYYFYDVNTGRIVRVNEKTYFHLLSPDIHPIDEDIDEELNQLYNMGYLKSTRVKYIEHPYTELLPYALETKIHIMILQVTQNCNLKCDYCVYSGGYNTRQHSNKRMSFKTAKSAIDFLKIHSSEKDKVYIGFYGGEPLLEYPLIYKCVNYAKQIMPDKQIEFSMTTNATLLSEDIIDFLVENDFKLTISLDGPEEVQNSNRHFASQNREGTYDSIMRKLSLFYNNYNDFYRNNVQFNAVISSESDFSASDEFFSENVYVKDSPVLMSGISTSYSKNKLRTSALYIQKEQYEIFKLFLAIAGKMDNNNVSHLVKEYVRRLLYIDSQLNSGSRCQLPIKGHRGGPCIPGIVRLFVNVEGDLFPCEKVCELANVCKMGNLTTGIDINRARSILNVERLTPERCCNCWAYEECTNCIRRCDNNPIHNKKNILDTCEGVKYSIEESFKDYMVLKEVGVNISKDMLQNSLNLSVPDDERYLLETPVIFVANLVVGLNKYTNGFGDSLARSLSKHGYHIKLVEGESILSHTSEITDSITRINHIFKKYEVEDNTLDAFIVNIPGNCIELSEKFCGDGGIYLKLFATSVPPDAVIINVPYSNAYEDYDCINQISSDVGIDVDCINVIPKFLDISISEEDGVLDYLSLSSTYVCEKIINVKGVFCAFKDTELIDMTDFLINLLAGDENNFISDDNTDISIAGLDLEEIVAKIFRLIVK